MMGCSFRGANLPRCDGAADYDFYGPEFCDASATLLVFAAGWSVPCMMDAPFIESEITQAYASRGVRVLTVYMQNPDGGPPSADHCMGWQTGAERPSSMPHGSLSNTMLMDPGGVTQVYTPGNAFPWYLVIDQRGHIVDVRSSENALANLIADLNALLALEGR
jgi:hypothetical protein